MKRIIALCFVLSLTMACGSMSSEESLVGTWRWEERGGEYAVLTIIAANNKCNVRSTVEGIFSILYIHGDGDGGGNDNGTWSVDNDDITLIWDTSKRADMFMFEFDTKGNHLTLTRDNGKSWTFTRE